MSLGPLNIFLLPNKDNLSFLSRKKRLWDKGFYILVWFVCSNALAVKCSFPGVALAIHILQSSCVASPERGLWSAVWFSSSTLGYFLWRASDETHATQRVNLQQTLWHCSTFSVIWWARTMSSVNGSASQSRGTTGPKSLPWLPISALQGLVIQCCIWNSCII